MPRLFVSVSSERWAMTKVESLRRLVLRLDLTVADDPELALDLATQCAIEVVEAKVGDREEDLARGAPVDVHLLVAATTRLHGDVHGRKDAGKGGRGQQHAAEELQRARIDALRDAAHIPVDGALGVEIGRADQQEATLAALLGNLFEKWRIDVVRDQLG